MKNTIGIFLIILLTIPAYTQPVEALVDEYFIHEDGGLIYDPLSREAKLTNQLDRYKNSLNTKYEINNEFTDLIFTIPQKAYAYDVIPIEYKLNWPDKAQFPIAIEATSFEDAEKLNSNNYYDLALPGKLDLEVKMIGSITADVHPEMRNFMKQDLSDKPGEYPPFIRKSFKHSGIIETGDLVWFKFNIKNTGNTILDSEGFGGISFTPELYKRDNNNNYNLIGKPYNTHIRLNKYLYPDKSVNIWILFMNNARHPQTYELEEGEYFIRFKTIYRWYKYFDNNINMWMGNEMYISEHPFTASAEPKNIPIPKKRVIQTNGGESDKITRWIHKFEEFMTSFDCHISKPTGKQFVAGTIYLQVAPWTKHVVVKLIKPHNNSIETKIIPIEINSEIPAIKYDSDHQVCIVKNGLKEPVILSLSMADMRANVQYSPFPERTILSDIKEMKKCGINLLSTTCMPWLYDDIAMHSVSGYGNEYANINKHNSDAYKYALDVARSEKIAIEGWGTYPFNRNNTIDITDWLTGKKYNFEILPDWGISHAEPELPKAVSQLWKYQLRRWGDNYFVNHDRKIPIITEDTRGMLRQDINGRWIIGEKSKVAFRKWIKEKYVTISSLNTTWNSDFKSFDEIDPEAGQSPSPYPSWPFLIYDNNNSVFHEWTKAMEDFDLFRTEQRINNYKDTLDIMRKDLSTAFIDLRTEGSNVIVDGIDPNSNNPHYRHIYYSQRRSALIAKTILKSDIVKYHADFPTIPFTPSELKYLVSKSVSQGIIPMYMPQFDNMRDMALNEIFGVDFQTHYNLPEPKKAVMMHVLTALYPWFKTVYEEGGTPGILWQDYECDGFATETQKAEMILFRQQLEKTLNQPDVLKQRRVNKSNMDTESLRTIIGKKSYKSIVK